MQLIRVALADDHILVRAGIHSLLQDLEGIEVIGEAEDGPSVLELVERYLPDIVLLDIGMPRMTGLEILPHLLRMHSGIGLIMLSMHREAEYVFEALRSGASGYLLKDSTVGELETAVRTVARGERYLSPAISRTVVDIYARSGTMPVAEYEALTPRQREILNLVAAGQTSKEIAQQLGLSYRTVEVHRMHLMRRLKVHDVAGLVKFAVTMGVAAPKN